MRKLSSLLNSYVLDGSGAGQLISNWDALEAWKPQDGILWVHLDYTKQKARNWLKKHAKLDKSVIKALTQEDTRPRSVSTREGTLLILRGVNLNPGEDTEDMVSIRIWVSENKIITLRRRPLQSIKDLVASIESGLGPKSASELVVRLINFLTDRMVSVIEALEEKTDDLETEIMKGPKVELQRCISDVRREATILRRYISPQKDAILKLVYERNKFIQEGDLSDIREASDRLYRYIEDLDLIRDRINITQEQLVSLLSDQLNKRVYILSIVSLVFLPLSFITGLLGINVGGIPGSQNPLAFIIVCLGLGGLTVMLIALLKLKRWL